MSQASIRIGTRKSKLALWQTEFVAELLNANGWKTEIVAMDTKGDQILNTSISKIGSKGVFTEEIEQLLTDGKIDIAVHSAKDLQSTLDANFEIIAFSEREEANDVIVSDQSQMNPEDGRPFVLGTSSTRRVAMLRHYFPHIEIVDMRGNLQTRVRKMRAGDCDGLLLAQAGVNRMNYQSLVRYQFALHTFTPAVGQGSIAVEAHVDLDPALRKFIRKCVNHAPTENRLLAERTFLKKLNGGCSIPAFAYATVKENELELNAGIISLDGQSLVRENATGNVDSPEALGALMGDLVLQNGGAAILENINRIIQ